MHEGEGGFAPPLCIQLTELHHAETDRHDDRERFREIGDRGKIHAVGMELIRMLQHRVEEGALAVAQAVVIPIVNL